VELRRPVLNLARPWVRATNTARDREVEATLLGELAEAVKQDGQDALATHRQAHRVEVEEAVAATRQFLADPLCAEQERALLKLLEGRASFAARPRAISVRLLSRIRRAAALLRGDNHDASTLHKLRLMAKQIRYGLEPLAALDARFAPAQEEAAAIQRGLGDNRDWQRLAERLATMAGPGQWVQAAERQAQKAHAAAPRRLREVTHFLKETGLTPQPPPPLDAARLRQRLADALRNMQNGDEVQSALEFADAAMRGHKRRDKSPTITAALRTALSLIEEAGVRDPQTLAAAVLKDVPRDRQHRIPPELEPRFGPEVAQAIAALSFDAHEDAVLSRAENRAVHLSRLAEAPDWVRLVSLAARLESLRFLIERGRAKKLGRRAARTAQAYLPIYATLESEPASILRARLTEILILLKVDIPALPRG
jgi:CHAD domain-containing protein